MDLIGFIPEENNPDVQIHEHNEDEAKNHISPHPTYPIGSDTEDLIQEGSDHLDEFLRQLESTSSQKRRAEEAIVGTSGKTKKEKIVERSTKRVKYMVPPPPTSGRIIQPLTKSTVAAFLISLQSIMKIRLEDYEKAYEKFQLLEGSKAPLSALKILGELLTDWYKCTVSLDGKRLLVDTILSCHDRKWSARYILPAAMETIRNFFKNIGQPNASDPTETQSTTSTKSYTPIIRDNQNTNVGVHTDGYLSQSLIRGNHPETFNNSVFSSVYSVCTRDGDRSYISKVKNPGGSIIIKLEMFKKSEVEELQRDKWWIVSDFRGTIMTDQENIIKTAHDLKTLMEKDVETHSNVLKIQSSVTELLCRYQHPRM